MTIFTKDQLARARLSLLEASPGKASSDIGGVEVEAEAMRMRAAVPPAIAPAKVIVPAPPPSAKGKGKTKVIVPAPPPSAKGKGKTVVPPPPPLVAPLVIVPPPPPPSLKAPGGKAAKRPGDGTGAKPSKKISVAAPPPDPENDPEVTEVEVDGGAEDEEGEEAVAEEFVAPPTPAIPAPAVPATPTRSQQTTVIVRASATAFTKMCDYVKQAFFGPPGTVPANGLYKIGMILELQKIIRDSHRYFYGDEATMTEFAQRWWAVKKYYPEALYETLIVRIMDMKAPGPYVPLLGQEYREVHSEVGLFGYVADEKGEGVHTFRILLQVVCRESDELAHVTSVVNLGLLPVKSRVSRWMDGEGYNNAEGAMYRFRSSKPPPLAPTLVAPSAMLPAMAPPPLHVQPPAPTAAPPTPAIDPNMMMMMQWMAGIQRGGGGSQVGTIFPTDSASNVGGGHGGRGGGGRGGGPPAYKNTVGDPWVPVWVAGANECWKCGGAHRPDGCRVPRPQQKCQGCGQLGHIAPDCPTNKRCV